MVQKKYKHDGTDIVDPHTRVKYDLYRDYLSDYIRIYFQNSRVHKLRIFIADLFCGGGLSKDETGSPVFGSPLIAIDVCEQMQKEISEKRSQPVEIEPFFFFNDVDEGTMKNLERFIKDFFPSKYSHCSFYCAEFEDIYSTVLTTMKGLESSSKGNRKFFFIDPCGYIQVPMQAIQMIKRAGKSEILWNFMIDYTAHYWAPQIIKNLNFEIIFGANRYQTEALISEISSLKDEKDWHSIRHSICKLIHFNSGFVTMSDFPIQMDTSKKFMTMIHLADSPKARDVMTGAHWSHGNVTQTYSYNGLEYENLSRQVGQDMSLFTFSEAERDNTKDRAREKIYDLISANAGISFPEITRRFAQQYSSLQEHDIESVIHDHGKDLVWFTAEGEETRTKTKKHSFQTSPQYSIPFIQLKK